MELVGTIKYILLKLVVILIYLVSHVYDYLSYPFYLLYYHPWRVGRYRCSNHARREERSDCLIYHSVQEPSHINVEIERHKLDTMEKVFDYVSLPPTHSLYLF